MPFDLPCGIMKKIIVHNQQDRNKKNTYVCPYVFFFIVEILNFASELNQSSYAGTRGKRPWIRVDYAD